MPAVQDQEPVRLEFPILSLAPDGRPLRGARQSVGDVAPGVTNRAAKPVLRCEIHPGRNGDPSARWLV